MNTIISCQSYNWTQIYEPGGTTFRDNLEEIFGALLECEIAAWEQAILSADEAAQLQTLLKKYNLRMPSIYRGGEFHTPEWKASAETVLQMARWAAPLGTRIVTVNPNPISWSDGRNKSDDELKLQAEALQTLGEQLAREGMRLAYHTHDPEMRAAAREFHHMMLATDPEIVGLCLDAHWIYRGAGNSQIALYDIVKLYGERICSVHLRQSHNGIWAETVEDGDIDYRPLAAELKRLNFDGPLVIERAIEAGTPQTMTPLEVHKRSADWVREMFLA